MVESFYFRLCPPVLSFWAFSVCDGIKTDNIFQNHTFVYLLILRMHCWEAFSLSQSVLRVGSQEVAWIWDRRPAPATPATPPRTVGDTATTGDEEPAAKKEFPNPTGGAVTADTGAAAAVRPLCAAAARGGEAGLELDWAPLAAGCPPGREVAKVESSEAPLPGPVTPKPRAPPPDCSPKLSAMAHKATEAGVHLCVCAY